MVTPRRRGTWTPLLLLLVLLGGLFAVFFPRGRRANEQQAEAGQKDDSSLRLPRAVSAPIAAASATAGDPERGQPAPPPDPPPLPPETQLLAQEFVPGTTVWDEAPVGNGGLKLRMLPLRYAVVAPEPISLALELVDGRGQRQPLVGAHVRVRPLASPDAAWIEVPIVNGVATLQPGPAERELLSGRVLAEGSADIPGSGRRAVPAILIYSLGPRARVTGRWRDWRQDGHLFLEAEIDVDVPGVFTLTAQILGPNLEPIAMVRGTQPLAAGRQQVKLRCWGKAIRDAGVDGPYRVREVVLTRDMNERGDYDPGPTIEQAHRTQPYHAADFAADAWIAPPRNVEEVGFDHPSQRNNPPPLRDRRERLAERMARR